MRIGKPQPRPEAEKKRKPEKAFTAEHLNPESSKGKTSGVVVQVPGVRGLSFSADYWEIARANIISSGGDLARS